MLAYQCGGNMDLEPLLAGRLTSCAIDHRRLTLICSDILVCLRFGNPLQSAHKLFIQLLVLRSCLLRPMLKVVHHQRSTSSRKLREDAFERLVTAY